MNEEIIMDFNNKEFLNAWELIANTNQSVFLTGKAGVFNVVFWASEIDFRMRRIEITANEN